MSESQTVTDGVKACKRCFQLNRASSQRIFSDQLLERAEKKTKIYFFQWTVTKKRAKELLAQFYLPKKKKKQ